MLLFGHAGLTLGATLLVREALKRKGDKRATFLPKSMDLRLLVLGSLLPDIIDKPIGLVLLAKSIGYGRIFCHSLLFLVVIAVSGLWLSHRHHQVWLFILALGTASHQLLDGMWAYPITLLWPLYGLKFPREELENYLYLILRELLTESAIYIPEIAGALIFLILLVKLIKKRVGAGLLRQTL